jgi:hypothetical protein
LQHGQQVEGLMGCPRADRPSRRCSRTGCARHARGRCRRRAAPRSTRWRWEARRGRGRGCRRRTGAADPRRSRRLRSPCRVRCDSGRRRRRAPRPRSGRTRRRYRAPWRWPPRPPPVCPGRR